MTTGSHESAPVPLSLLKYQILVDGKVVDVPSQGKDVVPLD